MVDLVTAADEARHVRGRNAGSTMPGVVSFGLIAGALVTVGILPAEAIGLRRAVNPAVDGCRTQDSLL
jgi:hypothetical protein